MSKELTIDQIRALASHAGLDRLTEKHLEQLTRATNAALARRDSLKRETLVPADEPAHVFRPADAL